MDNKLFHSIACFISENLHYLFLGKIQFTPVLPFKKRKLIETMPVGHLIKFVASYKRAFWRTAGMSGEVVHATMEGSCELDPVSYTMDGTTSKGNPALVGFIGSYAATKWTSISVSI